MSAVLEGASAARDARRGLACRGVVPAGGSVLSSRDLEVLRWAAEQYAVRLDQLALLLGLGLRSARRTADRLAGAGLVERRRLLTDEPLWVWLTGDGERVAGSGFRVWQPRVGMLAHVAAVNAVRLHVAHSSPESGWVCERTLARERRGRDHLPDGVVLAGAERHAVEVELTVKSERRLRSVIGELCGSYDRVVYFCAPAVRRRLDRLAAADEWPGLVVRDLPRPGQVSG